MRGGDREWYGDVRVGVPARVGHRVGGLCACVSICGPIRNFGPWEGDGEGVWLGGVKSGLGRLWWWCGDAVHLKVGALKLERRFERHVGMGRNGG